jgi:hypothetical protein
MLLSSTVPCAGRNLVIGQLVTAGINMTQKRKIWLWRIYKHVILHYITVDTAKLTIQESIVKYATSEFDPVSFGWSTVWHCLLLVLGAVNFMSSLHSLHKIRNNPLRSRYFSGRGINICITKNYQEYFVLPTVGLLQSLL